MTVPDKRVTIEEAIGEVRDGMTIGIGGWGSRRKPMALVRALARSDVADLTLVSYGGPDVGILCRTGKVRHVVYAFVSLDSIPLEPHFRAARQAGTVTTTEYDESMVFLGLQAAAWNVPYLPTRAGLGSDVLALNPTLRTVRSPYDDGDELLAMPAIHLDVAFVHMNVADRGGSARYLGVDPYFDDLFCQAARRRFVSTERIVATEDLLDGGAPQTLLLNRTMTDGVIETPNGAHFTSCEPDYGRDEEFQRAYAKTAAGDDAWDEFRARYLDVTEAEYQETLR